MRFFIALEIPDKNKKELEEIQQELKKIIPQIRLTDPNKFHLTIAFIGDQPDEIRKILEQAIAEAIIGIPPFSVSPGFIDGFPNVHYPRIIWIGVKGDVDKLVILRERIKDNLVNLDLGVDERRYEPHIALAKVKNFHLNKSQEQSLQQIILKSFQPIVVSSVKLFQSIPNHGFHQHNTLAEIQL